MSIVYCEYCHEYIDTDFNAEHFIDEVGECSEICIEQQEDERDDK